MNNVYNGIDIVEEAYREIEREQLKNDIPHMEQMVFLPSKIEANTDNITDIYKRISREYYFLRTHLYITANRPLYSNRNLFGPLVVLVKKILRKLIKFYVEPMVSDQNNFNSHLVKTLELLQYALIKKDEEINELKKILNKE